MVVTGTVNSSATYSRVSTYTNNGFATATLILEGSGQWNVNSSPGIFGYFVVGEEDAKAGQLIIQDSAQLNAAQ